MRTILIFLFLILSVFDFVAEAQQAEDPDRIKWMIIEGKKAAAAEALEERVTEGNPGEEELLLLLDLYYQAYDFNKLVSLFEAHNRVLGRNPDAMIAFARARLQTGYRSDAVTVLEELINMGYEDPGGLILLGRIYFEDEKWELAEPVFAQITSNIPDNLLFRTQHARIYSRMQQWDRAKEILQEVVDTDRTFLPAIVDLVSLHYAANEMDKARNLIDHALNRYPEESSLWNFSARIAYSRQQYQKATEHWTKVVEAGDADNNVFRGMGLSYYQLSEPDKALENFGRALHQNPDDKTSLMYSAMVYRQLKEWEKAKQLLTALYELYLGDHLVNALMQRAVVLEELGEIEQAISDYTLAGLLSEEDNAPDFYLAAIHDRHSDDTERVIGMYQKYLDSGDADPSLEEYARGRISMLREKLHFARGRE